MIFLGLFIFFVFLLAYYRKKSTNAQRAVEEAFWNRENEANNVRRQDISGLSYITIPLEKFPMNICDNEELNACEQTLTALSAKKILNLGSQTNTDLKLKYGPANLADLTEYDQNFTTLCRTLVCYAETLIRLGYETEAQPVLEFGISCGSDHSRNYKLLAELYHRQGDRDRLDSLLAQAKELDSPMQNTIIRHIEETLSSLS